MNKSIYKLKKRISPFKMAVFAVIISVTASVLVSGVSETGKYLITKEMDAVGMGGMSAVSYNSQGENKTDIDFYENISNMSETEYSTPVLYDSAVLDFSNGNTLNVMCWGVSDEADNVVSLSIVDGRMINNTDINSNSFVCLIDEDIAKQIYKRTNICGKKINVTVGENTASFTVIGTIKKGSNILNNLTGDMVPNFIYVPYTTMKNLSSKSNFDQIMFTSYNENITEEKFIDNLSIADKEYENLVVKLTDLSKQKEQITNIADIAFISLFAVSGVAVVVCSMAVAASVNTAVVMRKKDIGIKMSMGASKFDITMEFLYSAISAAAIGIFISSVLMFLLIKTVQIILGFNIYFDYTLIGLSIFVTILLTALFSLIPSYNAAKMPPIKALNRE